MCVHSVCVCACIRAKIMSVYLKAEDPPVRLWVVWGRQRAPLGKQSREQECLNMKGHAAEGLYLSLPYSSSSSLSLSSASSQRSTGLFSCLHSSSPPSLPYSSSRWCFPPLSFSTKHYNASCPWFSSDKVNGEDDNNNRHYVRNFWLLIFCIKYEAKQSTKTSNKKRNICLQAYNACFLRGWGIFMHIPRSPTHSHTDVHTPVTAAETHMHFTFSSL